MTLTPMLFVDDVAASYGAWYQTLLGATSAHGGEEFEMLMLDGELSLQLHHADAEEHGDTRLPASAPPRCRRARCTSRFPTSTPRTARRSRWVPRSKGEPTFIPSSRVITEFVAPRSRRLRRSRCSTR